ncbi:MAG: TonB-dependent receptor [Steroidobacteraceae bacterium]
MSRTGTRVPERRTASDRTVAWAVALALQAGAGSAARAADAAPADAGASSDTVEQVVVTGSRITRRDFEANSPIQTVDASALENQSAIALEDTLNDLPQFTPAATAYTQVQDGELINTGSTTTAGAATLSLRGLGPNRNLVLIDGYRAVPVNATMAVDLNTIPAAAVQRVEVITGGASSVYGADAVAGVVNFILKKDFQGVDLDAQYGSMQNGEAGEVRASALMGLNAPEGRGNIMIGMEYAHREAVEWKDVGFYRKAMVDPTTNGTISIVTDPYFQVNDPSGLNNPINGGVIDSIFNQAPAGTVLRGPTGLTNSGRVYLNQDGTVYTGAAVFDAISPIGAGSSNGLYKYKGPLTQGDFPFRKIDGTGELEEYIPGHRANVPLERYSLFARGIYDLTDTISASLQATSVETSTYQLWQVSPATGGWSSTIPHGTGIYAPSLNANGSTNAAYLAGGRLGLSCPATGGCTNSQAFPVSPELGRLLDARANPNATWNLSYSLDFPYYGLGKPRSIDTTQRTNQFSAGLKGKWDAIDGGWDIVASHGTTTLGMLLEGYVALQRFRTIMQSPNFGTGFFAQGNAGPPGNGFAGGVAQCTSGIPVFRPHAQISQDCLDAFVVTLQHQAKMDQDFVEANLQGKLFTLPAGDARFSVGTHWRANEYRYIFDTLNTQDSFLDLGLGTFPADNTRGKTSVKEIYGEALVPVIKGVPLIEHLNLELGYRWSDYKFQGGVGTYKALVDWGVTETLRLRGGYQLATRAPNIAEMFQAQSQTWLSLSPGDPCGLNTVASYGANPATNPANAARVQTLCRQLMGAVGASAFYDQGNVQPGGGSMLWFVNATGNPNVNPEEAKTYTAGLVFQPHWEHALLQRFSATVDWYLIKISDMIAVEPGSSVYEACMSAASNPTFDVSNANCQRIIRNPSSGGATAANVSYINAGDAKVSGIDFAVDWRAEMADLGLSAVPGHIGLNVLVSSLLALETQATRTSPTIDWKGSLGPDTGTSLNNGAYDYRLFTTLNYGFDAWSFSLRHRFLPKAKSALEAASTTPVTNRGAESSYNVFDLSGSWNITAALTARFGVENLFDRDPVITGRRVASCAGCSVEQNPTSGAGVTEAGFYDVLGRRFYVGMKAKF